MLGIGVHIPYYGVPMEPGTPPSLMHHSVPIPWNGMSRKVRSVSYACLVGMEPRVAEPRWLKSSRKRKARRKVEGKSPRTVRGLRALLW